MNRCIFTIAGNAAREVTREPIFYLVSCGGVALTLLSFSFTLFAFGEESRMIKEMGISTIAICCLCLASLAAANTISKEREKGTLVTVLSKPVDKGTVLLGKFFGILMAVSSIFMILGFFLIISLCLKESLDYHVDLPAAFDRIGYPTVYQLLFAFLSVAIMCAIATAGSVCLPLISNLSCCMVIYVIGNLMNFFQDGLQMYEIGNQWYLAFFLILLPNLEEFSIIGSENKFGSLGAIYPGLLMVYAVVYIAFVIVLACVIFDRKECR